MPDSVGRREAPHIFWALPINNSTTAAAVDSGINIMGKRQRRIARQARRLPPVQAQPQPELVTFEVGDKVRIRNWHKVMPGKFATIKSSPINTAGGGRSYYVSIWRDLDEPLRLKVDHCDLELRELSGRNVPLLSSINAYDAAVLLDDGMGVMV